MSRSTVDISTNWRTSEPAIFEVRACTRMATLITRSPIRSRSVVDFRLESNGQALVDLPLDQVQFLLAILDGQKRHARIVGQQVADVERRIPGDQAGLQREPRQIVRPAQSRLGHGCRLGRARDGYSFFSYGFSGCWRFAWHKRSD